MNHRTQNMHERFLRHIWNKQYLKNKLETTDGSMLTVLNVGQLNSDGGPDFLNAKLKIGNITYFGDVEIHRTAIDWFQHRHQGDPRYNKVVLHVVLEGTGRVLHTIAQSGREIPVLVLGMFLSESIHSIWQKTVLDERALKSQKINCFNKNYNYDTERIERWLNKLAIERMEIKLRRFYERLKQLAQERRMAIHECRQPYGKPSFEGKQNEIPPPLRELTQKDFSKKELWEQILYEGIMEGLGYSKNREPFLKLAQNATLELIDHNKLLENERPLEALLFGVSGLIPKIKTIKHKESQEYIRRLSRDWRTLRSSYYSEVLHPADWQFCPTRPSNFPTIRIAAACILIKNILLKDLFRRFIQTLKSKCSVSEKEKEIISLFNVEVNDFWKQHYNFDKTVSNRFTALGIARIREIIINTVIPIALLYARIFKDKAVKEGTLEVYQSLPPSENNSITRIMEQQLIKKRLPMKSVSRQQAAIQLYKFYCTEGRCLECEINI